MQIFFKNILAQLNVDKNRDTDNALSYLWNRLYYMYLYVRAKPCGSGYRVCNSSTNILQSTLSFVFLLYTFASLCVLLVLHALSCNWNTITTLISGQESLRALFGTLKISQPKGISVCKCLLLTKHNTLRKLAELSHYLYVFAVQNVVAKS